MFALLEAEQEKVGMSPFCDVALLSSEYTFAEFSLNRRIGVSSSMDNPLMLKNPELILFFNYLLTYKKSVHGRLLCFPSSSSSATLPDSDLKLACGQLSFHQAVWKE